MTVIAQGADANMAKQMAEVSRSLRLLNTVSDPEFTARNLKALTQPESAWTPTTAAELRKICGR
jgi:hypothetical protein